MTEKADSLARYRYWNKTRFNPFVERDNLTAIGEIVVIWGHLGLLRADAAQRNGDHRDPSAQLEASVAVNPG